MRVVSEEQLAAVLSGLPGVPRVVAGGNFATPRRALAVLDGAVAEYRLFLLNAQPPRRGSATSFVSPDASWASRCASRARTCPVEPLGLGLWSFDQGPPPAVV